MIAFPGQSTQATTSDGYFLVPWLRFLEDIRNRFGGSQDITMRATDDTHLTFSFKGSDGVVRTGSVTLS